MAGSIRDSAGFSWGRAIESGYWLLVLAMVRLPGDTVSEAETGSAPDPL